MKTIQEVELKSVAKIIMGTSPKGNTYNNTGNGLPLINGPTEFGDSHPDCTLFTTKSLKACEVGDLIFCVRGSTTGRMNWANKKYSLGRGVCSIRGKTQTDTIYIRYCIEQSLNRLLQLASGATFPNLTKETIFSFKIPYPDDRERVVDIIQKYDMLANINRRRIQLLEEAAQLLFREWFVYFRFPRLGGQAGHDPIRNEFSNGVKIVDGVPEGWERRQLEDIAKVKKGRNITFEQAVEGDIPVVGGGLEPTYYHNKANVSAPVITISASGANAGFVNLYDTNIWASDCSYINKNSTKYIYSLYLRLKSLQTSIFGMQVGAAQPHVYPKDLNRLRILIAPDDLCKQFEHLVTPIFTLIMNLKLQNQKLAQARDLLLPRLMSGKIEV